MQHTQAQRDRIGTWLRMLAWGGAGTLLLLPLIAMQFTSEVQWTGSDFAVFGGMLLIACTGFDLLMRRSGSVAYRLGAAAAVGGAFLLVWVNLAVGIIGSEQNDANWMYVGLLGLEFGAVLLSRFKPAGMARAMFVTAGGQVAIATITLAFQLGTDGIAWPRDVLGVTAIFTLIWLTAAMLFLKAARDRG